MINRERGDTLVEVLLSTVIISIVLAGAYSLSNRATRINQTAIERTTAVNLMREQIELVRGVRTTGYDTTAWKEILSKVNTGSPKHLKDGDKCPPDSVDVNNGFFVQINPVLDYNSTDFIQDYTGGASPDANSDLYTVWLEAYDQGKTIDFTAKACWEGIGGETTQYSELILRLAK